MREVELQLRRRGELVRALEVLQRLLELVRTVRNLTALEVLARGLQLLGRERGEVRLGGDRRLGAFARRERGRPGLTEGARGRRAERQRSEDQRPGLAPLPSERGSGRWPSSSRSRRPMVRRNSRTSAAVARFSPFATR